MSEQTGQTRRTSRHGDAEVTTESSGVQLDVVIGGEVDLANAREVADAIQRANPSSFERVLVDLSLVTYLDSAGLSMLVDLARQLRTGRSRLTCHVPPGSRARRIVALTGLEAVLDVGPTDTEPGAEPRESG